MDWRRRSVEGEMLCDAKKMLFYVSVVVVEKNGEVKSCAFPFSSAT
jgi:hypothetical protein